MTSFVPVPVEFPVMFSTMKFWPEISVIFAARVLAKVSVPPPAPCGTMIVIVLSGSGNDAEVSSRPCAKTVVVATSATNMMIKARFTVNLLFNIETTALPAPKVET